MTVLLPDDGRERAALGSWLGGSKRIGLIFGVVARLDPRKLSRGRALQLMVWVSQKTPDWLRGSPPGHPT